MHCVSKDAEEQTECSFALEPCVETQSTGQVSQFVSDRFQQLTDHWTTGNLTLGDIMEILPFEDSLVVLELDGETIWAALEAGLETWPAHEGYSSFLPIPRCQLTSTSSRFPVISGFRVVWDSRHPPRQRVLSVHLDPEISESTTDTPTHASGAATPAQPSAMNVSHDPLEEVKREKGGRMYKIVTREYLAEGHDGYDVLKGNKYLIEDEGGQIMSAVVRKYLLGKSVVG